MNRRQYLAGIGAGALGALAGCTDRLAGDGTPTRDDGATPGGSSDSAPGVSGELDLPVPRSELKRGASKDGIPAIVDPAFGDDWSGVTSSGRFGGGEQSVSLAADDPVIGVARGGEARAYPLRILNWHEIVNDTLGAPLLVTYCPLCGSAVTAERTVNGEETVFGVSGLLWRNDLVMYDRRTESLWSQIVATAIRGPRTGAELSLVPSTLTTWGEWRDAHPETVVLRPPPESGTVEGEVSRDYSTDPYAGYDSSRDIGIGGGGFDDDRLHPKATVVGISHGGVSRAYPQERVREEGVVNDTVGGLPVVVTVGGETLVAYERTVGGETLTFRRDGERHLRADGSRWRVTTGTAVSGPHEGATLTQANDVSPEFWFAWLDFHPDTEVYGE